MNAIVEDPEIIRMNIEQYRKLLRLGCAEEMRQRLERLLAEACRQLPAAEAAAAQRAASPRCRLPT